MKNLILITFLFLSTHAFAESVDFTGHWTGAGVFEAKDTFSGVTQNSPCAVVELFIEHTPQAITLKRYHANCGTMEPDWGPDVMEIRGSDIYEHGEKTGTFDGELLLTTTSDGGVDYAFNLRIKKPAPGQPVILETYYGTHNMSGAAVIEGKLQKAP